MIALGLRVLPRTRTHSWPKSQMLLSCAVPAELCRLSLVPYCHTLAPRLISGRGAQVGASRSIPTQAGECRISVECGVEWSVERIWNAEYSAPLCQQITADECTR